ncbi:hypothetical protein RFZ03_07390, partial [Acinetobacter baumannii]|nr:hypothetical protein [Acinetobacter baumannii]
KEGSDISEFRQPYLPQLQILPPLLIRTCPISPANPPFPVTSLLLDSVTILIPVRMERNTKSLLFPL